MKLVNRKL